MCLFLLGDLFSAGFEVFFVGDLMLLDEVTGSEVLGQITGFSGVVLLDLANSVEAGLEGWIRSCA